MNAANPAFILRNYLLEEAITKAEAGDFSQVKEMQKMVENPFEEPSDQKYTQKLGNESMNICVSCSS